MVEAVTSVAERTIRAAVVAYSHCVAEVRLSRNGLSLFAGPAVLGALALGAALPAATGAYATIGAAPIAGSPGLPDGRVYEQVSPADKNGNFVRQPPASIGLADADGEAVVFVGTGAMGNAAGGLTEVFVSKRSHSGWQTSSTRPRQPGEPDIFGGRPLTLVPSSSFSSFLFTTYGSSVSAEPPGLGVGANLYLSDDPAVEPTWIAQPKIVDPIPMLGENNSLRNYLVVGGTPDFSTVYFAYAGTLLPQDAPRAPHVGGAMGATDGDGAWGLYEWSGGTLAEAGVLPDGTLDPFGAVPAATAEVENVRVSAPGAFPQALDNEISTDGSRVFFVSPDPKVSAPTKPELYVRETGPTGVKSTTLVSQSQLPGHDGEPAPDGPQPFSNTPIFTAEPDGTSYVFASPDGSQAFFASTDRLTSAAPANGSVKEYDYDLDTGQQTYLPGVTGSLVATSPDGSDFIFENTATTPSELDLWTSGTDGGRVTPIVQLPPSASGPVDVSGARSSTDGAAFVFRTNSPLSGFNNGGGFEQVYRYSVGSAELICASCPPVGVTPSGDAQVSHDDETEEPVTTVDTDVISSDGSQVFFDSSSPLVPQATNGMRNVYEWENGHVYLISSGRSGIDSYILDSSASGGDVFFTTSEGLAPGDTDGSADVYDARIPRRGDRPPPSAVACEGDVCQGPPSVPSPLTAPASATFSGLGNVAPPPVEKPQVKPRSLTRAQKLAQALRVCGKKPKRKRQACIGQARKHYGAGSKGAKSNRRSK
jgi:hypothetical protein